jgi:hypothetical protein
MPRLLLAVIGLTSSATLAYGSVWESPDWALTSSLAASVGYDSDLTLSNGGPGDSFVQADPSLTLQRKNSSSDIELTGTVTATDFLDNKEPQHTDYKVVASYDYPKADNVIPMFDASVSWTQVTEANEWLGLYVEHDRGSASISGYLPVTGRLGVRTTADYTLDNYILSRLNDYRNARLFTGLAFERDSGAEASLNVGGSAGSSTPNDQATYGGPVHSRSASMTARIQGDITPKVSGSAYAGFSDVSYSGAYSDRFDLPIAGADLTWGVTTRTTLVLAAYSGADFSPDGQSVRTTHAFLSFTHVIVDQWQLTVRGGPAFSVFSRTVRLNTDTMWDLGSSISYQPSTRFHVDLGFAFNHQNSDALNNQFQREAVTLGVSYNL